MENNSPSATLQRSQTPFPRDAFNPWLTIAVLLGLPVIIFGITAAAILFAVSRGETTLPGAQAWFTGLPGVQVQTIFELVAIVYLLLLLPAIAKLPLRGIGFRAVTVRDAGYILGGVIAMVVLTNGLASLLQTTLHTKVNEQAVNLYLNMKTPLAKAEFAFLGVAVAAAFEEIVFRIFIFNAVRKWGGFWTGAVISGLLFGFAHVQSGSWAQTVVLAVPLTLGGMVLSAVYAKTENAYAPIATHGLFNAVTLVVLFFAPQLAK